MAASRETHLSSMSTENPTAQLIEAVRNKKVEAARKAIEAKADVNYAPLEGSALHWAVRNKDLPMVRLLLENQAKTFLTEYSHEAKSNQETFTTPIQLAANLNAKPILGYLFEHRTQLRIEDLRQLLDFCHEYYVGKRDTAQQDDALHDDALLDYAASRLTGINVGALTREGCNREIYLAHLKSRKGRIDGVNLEGWALHKFLPLRIRSFLEMIIHLEQNQDKLPGFTQEQVVEKLCREVLVNHEMLDLHQCCSLITETLEADATNDIIKKAHKALARDIEHHICHLAEGHEYSIPTGWPGHMVYVNAARQGNNLVLRVDNVGNGCNDDFPPKSRRQGPLHEEDAQHSEPDKGVHYYFPHILGQVALAAFKPDVYLFDLVQISAAVKPTKAKAQASIYNFNETLKGLTPITAKKLGYPSAKEQSVKNCVVEGCQLGLETRLGSELYMAVLRREASIVAPKPGPYRELRPFWSQHLEARKFSPYLRQQFKNYCQTQSKIQFMFDGREMPLKAIYINLQLVAEGMDSAKKQPNAVAEKKEQSGSFQGKPPERPESNEKNHELKRPIAVENIFSLSNAQSKKPLLILGAPGIGKSTFCNYVVLQWASDESWLQSFDWVFRLPLRHFTADRYPKVHYSLLDVVLKECFSGSPVPEWALPYLQRAVEQEQILWLLDGGDELPQPLPPQLQNVWKALLQQKHLIITTRPHVTDLLPEATKLKITGFTDQNIVSYVKKFFMQIDAPGIEHKADEVEEKKSDTVVANASIPPSALSLLGFLENHPNARELAHAPIMLELICSLWQQNEKAFAEQENFSLTSLYHQITLWLLRRFLSKESMGQTHLISEGTLLRRLGTELICLEKIAFVLMQENKIILTHANFEGIVPEIRGDDPSFYADILKIGLLKPVDKVNEPGPDCQFIHLTVQEFLAARYLVRCLRSDVTSAEHQAALYCIQQEKFNSRYTLLFRFAAGLISILPGNESVLPIFWNYLLAPPCDSVGTGSLRLWMPCLEEAKCDVRIPRRDELIASITQEINTLLRIIMGNCNEYTEIKLWLLPLLAECMHVVKSVSFVDTVLLIRKENRILEEKRWIKEKRVDSDMEPAEGGTFGYSRTVREWKKNLKEAYGVDEAEQQLRAHQVADTLTDALEREFLQHEAAPLVLGIDDLCKAILYLGENRAISKALQIAINAYKDDRNEKHNLRMVCALHIITELGKYSADLSDVISTIIDALSHNNVDVVDSALEAVDKLGIDTPQIKAGVHKILLAPPHHGWRSSSRAVAIFVHLEKLGKVTKTEITSLLLRVATMGMGGYGAHEAVEGLVDLNAVQELHEVLNSENGEATGFTAELLAKRDIRTPPVIKGLIRSLGFMNSSQKFDLTDITLEIDRKPVEQLITQLIQMLERLARPTSNVDAVYLINEVDSLLDKLGENAAVPEVICALAEFLRHPIDYTTFVRRAATKLGAEANIFLNLCVIERSDVDEFIRVLPSFIRPENATLKDIVSLVNEFCRLAEADCFLNRSETVFEVINKWLSRVGEQLRERAVLQVIEEKKILAQLESSDVKKRRVASYILSKLDNIPARQDIVNAMLDIVNAFFLNAIKNTQEGQSDINVITNIITALGCTQATPPVVEALCRLLRADYSRHSVKELGLWLILEVIMALRRLGRKAFTSPVIEAISQLRLSVDHERAGSCGGPPQYFISIVIEALSELGELGEYPSLTPQIVEAFLYLFEKVKDIDITREDGRYLFLCKLMKKCPADGIVDAFLDKFCRLESAEWQERIASSAWEVLNNSWGNPLWKNPLEETLPLFPTEKLVSYCLEKRSIFLAKLVAVKCWANGSAISVTKTEIIIWEGQKRISIRGTIDDDLIQAFKTRPCQQAKAAERVDLTTSAFTTASSSSGSDSCSARSLGSAASSSSFNSYSGITSASSSALAPSLFSPSSSSRVSFSSTNSGLFGSTSQSASTSTSSNNLARDFFSESAFPSTSSTSSVSSSSASAMEITLSPSRPTKKQRTE